MDNHGFLAGVAAKSIPCPTLLDLDDDEENLGRPKGYQEFESTSLRHAVSTAEKFCYVAPEIREKGRLFAVFPPPREINSGFFTPLRFRPIARLSVLEPATFPCVEELKVFSDAESAGLQQPARSPLRPRVDHNLRDLLLLVTPRPAEEAFEHLSTRELSRRNPHAPPA